MAADGGVAAKLASAKHTLSDVSHSNVDTGGQHAWTKPHEYSHASYSAARSASSTPKAKTGIAGEAADAGAGIKARMETEAAARKSIAQDNP